MIAKLLAALAVISLTACYQPPLPEVIGPPVPQQQLPQGVPNDSGMDATTAGLLGAAAGVAAGSLLSKSSSSKQPIIINRTTIVKQKITRNYTAPRTSSYSRSYTTRSYKRR